MNKLVLYVLCVILGSFVYGLLLKTRAHCFSYQLIRAQVIRLILCPRTGGRTVLFLSVVPVNILVNPGLSRLSFPRNMGFSLKILLLRGTLINTFIVYDSIVVENWSE